MAATVEKVVCEYILVCCYVVMVLSELNLVRSERTGLSYAITLRPHTSGLQGLLLAWWRSGFFVINHHHPATLSSHSRKKIYFTNQLCSRSAVINIYSLSYYFIIARSRKSPPSNPYGLQSRKRSIACFIILHKDITGSHWLHYGCILVVGVSFSLLGKDIWSGDSIAFKSPSEQSPSQSLRHRVTTIRAVQRETCTFVQTESGVHST